MVGLLSENVPVGDVGTSDVQFGLCRDLGVVRVGTSSTGCAVERIVARSGAVLTRYILRAGLEADVSR
jgi:hypothetical protein